MKSQLLSVVLVGWAACAALAQTSVPSPGPGATAQVAGKVTLVRADSGAIGQDASEVVVWLVPVGGARLVLPEHSGTYRMLQRNKKFEPNLLVVPLDSVVSFPNLDPWFHNVFSLYRGKRFDLGLYEAGKDKQVRFDHLGASYIFCNIHPEMTAVVLTIDSDYSAISEKNGDFAITNVSPGGYQLHVWYANANSKDLVALERPMVVEEGANHLPPIVIPVIGAATGHKNKYGKDYDPQVAQPDY
jgi:plastocyanin